MVVTTPGARSRALEIARAHGRARAGPGPARRTPTARRATCTSVGTIAGVAEDTRPAPTATRRVELDGLQPRAAWSRLIGVDTLVAEVEPLDEGDAGDDWGAGGRGPRPLPARPRRAALVPRPAAPLARSRWPGSTWPASTCPSPATARQKLLESRRRRALPEDQPRPRRPAPQGAGDLTGAGPLPPRHRRRSPAPSPATPSSPAVGEGSNVLLFVLGFLAARLLGPTAFGEYSTAFAFVGLFRILPDFGMSYASTLAISRDRSRGASGWWADLLGFQAVLSVVTLALCLGIGARAATTASPGSRSSCCPSTSSSRRSSPRCAGCSRASSASGRRRSRCCVERTLLLVLGVAVLAAGRGVRGLRARLRGRAPRRHRRPRRLRARAACCPSRPAFDPPLWGELLRKGLPFAYAGAMITLFFQVDTVHPRDDARAAEVGLVPLARPRARGPDARARASSATRSSRPWPPGRPRAPEAVTEPLPPRVEVPAAGRPAHRRLRPARVGPLHRPPLRRRRTHRAWPRRGSCCPRPSSCSCPTSARRRSPA